MAVVTHRLRTTGLVEKRKFRKKKKKNLMEANLLERKRVSCP